MLIIGAISFVVRWVIVTAAVAFVALSLVGGFAFALSLPVRISLTLSDIVALGVVCAPFGLFLMAPGKEKPSREEE